MKTKFNGILTLLLALVVQISFAQEKTVSGTVSDNSGALPGVSVLIKGTSTGTETDFDGKYSIKAKAGDVLSFSYLGYKTIEKTVGSSNTINVTMVEDANVLDEVVVTALGIKREKQSVGFAQQTVKSENLVRSRETDISNALAGKVAGVQFRGAPSSGFGNSSIRLRGDSNVLYIVDNIKVSASSDINTDDIEELSVLKGAAATALYGPDGINGVIVITTKSAKKGQSTIQVNHSTAMEQVYLLPEYQNEYGGGYSQNFLTFNFNPAIHPAAWSSFDGQKMVEYYADESWGPKLDGQMVRHWDSWIEGDAEWGKLRPFSPNPNNVRDFYETGITNNTALTFSKGGEKYSVRANIANIDRTAVSPNSDRKTVNASINASFDINDKLKAFAMVNYQDRRTKNFPDNGYGNLGSNFNQWWQRQLDMNRLRNYRRNGKIVSWNINGPTNTAPLYWDNPHFEVYENLNFQTKNAMYGRMGLGYTLNEDINASIEVRKTLNSYESNNRSAFDQLGGQVLPSYSEAESYNTTDELFGIVNYNKDITEDFDISASVGFEITSFYSKSINANTSGGLTTHGFYSLNTSVDRPNVSSRRTTTQRKSIFSKASLGYKGILFLDGSARLDWSSTAFENDNRVETFGGSAAFIFSKVIPQNDILSFGKLRASFAQAPSFPGAYALQETYGIGTPYGSKGTLFVGGTYVNPQLRGGVRQEMEIGTEVKLFGSRLGFDVTYFNKKDKELPVGVSLDPATGYTSTRSNSGQQTYTGIEVGINGSPIKTEDFVWETYINFATLKRTVDFIAEGITTNVLSTSWRGIQLQERVGEEWGAIYGRAFKRDAAGKILLSGTGSPQFDTNQYLGNVLPDFTGGFTNNFRYKNFNLGFDIDFQKGGKIFSVTRMFNNYSGLGIETVGNNAAGNPVRDPISGSAGFWHSTKVSDANADTGGVLIEGVDMTTGADAAYYVEPQLYWGRLFALHERWLYDASYVKLRTIRFDYTFDKKMIENTPFSDINIGLFANNVWMIHSAIPGLDPSEAESLWTEGGQSPNVRTAGINVKLTF
ncbi:MAG: SusC/RagA family TonB-linked outer membrane protein [Flavobacteriaceae bacterium]|nr:SusC/RagA family TonB-linked outer membrane protein [Flavobacteriaceae bacterium]